jgi:adenylate cyclase
LEGSVHREADKGRIGVELVDASTGTEKWTARYDRPLKEIFAVQDEIVGKVVTTLGLLLKLDEMNLPEGGNAQPTQNLEAFDDLLRSLEYIFRATKDDNAKAREWAEKAIELDPKFAQAYAVLGWTYLDDAWNQWSANPLGDLEHAMTAARKALAFDDSNATALALVSDLDWMQCRFDQAVADGERAVSINPNYAQGYLALSDALINDRRPEEALRAAQRAMRLDPASRDFYAYAAGNAYSSMGRYQDAVKHFKRTVTAHPNMLVAHLGLVGAHVELGREQEARAEAVQVMRISPQFTVPPPTTCWTKDVAWNKHMQDELRKAGLK